LAGDFTSTFFLTITNPMTILSFLAVFAGLGLSSMNSTYLEASSLVFGVFLGSAAWWLILSEGVTLFRKKVSEKVMKWINHLAGAIIIAFGIAALITTAI
jgi:threonine/homoserine/homoserine lactone efflux protein